MDNLAHSLVGMLAAETAYEVRKNKGSLPADWRRIAWFVSFGANNFPDLDFLYARTLTEKAGTILHHRGHTHTFVGALGISFILFAGIFLFFRRKRPIWTVRDWGWLYGVLLFGLFVHIGMDGLNSYGIHPFWPFSNRWFYGDTLFIIEPWLWIVLLAGLYWAVPGRGLKLAFFFLLVGVNYLAWAVPIIPKPLALLFSTASVVLMIFFKKLAPRVRVAGLWAACTAITLAFSLGGLRARHAVAKADFMKGTPVDIILNPMPGNPACWLFISVSTEGNEYSMTRGVYSAALVVVKPKDCAGKMDVSPFSPLESVVSNDPHFQSVGHYHADRVKLAYLAKENCWVEAGIRFDRAPYIVEVPGKVRLGDLRFAWRNRATFADMEIEDPPPRCPQFVPPWAPPRGDLLGN